MSAKKSKKPDFSADLEQIDEFVKHVAPFFKAIEREEPLPCVVLGAAYIDQCVRYLLERFFIDSTTAEDILQQDRGVLGSFFSRARVAYCCGLIDKPLFQTLECIAEIRNKFAHSHQEMSFANEDIAALCDKLTPIGRVVGGAVEPWVAIVEPSLPSDSESRRKFMDVSMQVAMFLVALANKIVRQDRPPAGWGRVRNLTNIEWPDRPG